MLLKVGEEHLCFTEMDQASALNVRVGTGDTGLPEVRIRFAGEMTSATTGQKVAVELDIPATLARHRLRRFGKPSRWLRSIASSWTSPDLVGRDILPGLRWQPFSLTSGSGSVKLRGETIPVTHIHGELEEGHLTNLNTRRLAISYDYVAVAAPGPEGYAFVDFTSHSLHPTGALGRLMEWYARSTGSDSLTLTPEQELSANPHGVQRPASSDSSVLLFETRVDLGLASLRRQMIQTVDSRGRPLFGLREIFEPVERTAEWSSPRGDTDWIPRSARGSSCPFAPRESGDGAATSWP
jgi:hypothetical protein